MNNRKKQHKTDLIKKCILVEDGNPTRYRLQKTTDNLNQSELCRKMYFGDRDRDRKKPHKTILMVGETGSGKTTLINVMVNYMLGVQRKDKVWFEITDEQSGRTSAESQTSKITVYGVYLQESPVHLTIIDTPGYGDTYGTDDNCEIGMSLQIINNINDRLHEIDAVCLVMKATQNQLSERLIYTFVAVQSSFGKDIAENIVLLFTHSDGFRPKNALTAVKEAGVKCAVSKQKNQPVFFLFNNHQSDAADEEHDMIQEFAWDLSFRGMEGMFKLIDNMKPKSLQMTQDVLQTQKQLEAKISNVRLHVQEMEQKQNELKQTKAALEKNKEYVKSNKNFEYEVDVFYKEKVDIDRSVASMATCCTICEENCHYPGCWWVSDLSWCSVMEDNHCTVCTEKCHYSKHVKSPKIYVTKTKKEKRTYKDLKKAYDNKIGDGESLVKSLEEEMEELHNKKVKMVNEAFWSVKTLQMITLNTDPLITDFLVEKLKEINEPEKAKTMEEIKKRAGERKQGAVGYLTRFIKINK